MGERSGRFDVGALAAGFSHPVVAEGLPALSNTFTVDALLERTPERRYRGRGGGSGAARGSVRGAAASRGRPRRAPAVPLAPPAEAGGAAGGAAIQPGSPLSEEEQEQEAQQEVQMDVDLPEQDAGAGLLYAVPGAPPGQHGKEGDPLVLALRRPTRYTFSFLVAKPAPLLWRRSSGFQWHEVVSQVDAGGHPEEGARLDDHGVGAEDRVHHDFGVCRSCFPTQLPGYISAIASQGFGKPSDPFPPPLHL